MLIENLVGDWAVPSERQNTPERSDDAISVWRVSGNNGTRLRFCCRMGQLTVWEEPSERRVLSVNLGRLAEVHRRALVLREEARRGLTSLRRLEAEEELACWAQAATDPETRFFETLKGGPERFGGRRALLGVLTSVLRALGRKIPWPEQAEFGG